MPDPESFDDFYVSTRAFVLGQLTAMTLDRDLAADAVQEAYTRAWQRWARVSQLDDPTAWVRTVAWRLAVSHFRRRAVADKFLRRVRTEPAAPETAAEIGVDVIRALRGLSPEHRRVLVLHEMIGMTVRDIATETSLSEGTVKSRLSRGRERLSAALGSDYLTADEIPAANSVREQERP